MESYAKLVLTFWLVCSVASAAFAQPSKPQQVSDVGIAAREIINRGGDSVVSSLVKLGSTSASAAAVVIVEVVKAAPRLLEEVIQGLSVVLDEAELQKALELAANALKSTPALARLLDNTIKIFGCSSIARCAERINEVPGNIEDGRTDPPASPA